jgi:CHAT domain-containing protein
MMHLKTGSVPLMDAAVDMLSRLNEPAGPRVLKYVAAYVEAVLDRHRLFPEQEALDRACTIAYAALQDCPPLHLQGAAACLASLGRANYECGLAATMPAENYEGAPVIFTGLENCANTAVDTLRRTVNSLPPGSPILPLCLSRFVDALVLLSRFKSFSDHRRNLLEEALGTAQTAVELTPPRSPHVAAVHRSLAGALRWSRPDDPAIVEHLETAARAGAETDLMEGLEAAFEWGLTEPIRASAYVDPILRQLYAQLKVDGLFRMGLLQDKTEWIVKSEGGQGRLERWHRPTWMKHAAEWPARLSAEWARIGQYEAAILAIEQRPILVLDCGRAEDMGQPSWSDLLRVSQAYPLVYLVAGESVGHALVLDATRNPAAFAIPLPGFTAEAISLLLHGKPQADFNIEGLEYTMGHVVSPDAPLGGGLIPAYAAWQAGNGGERNEELWFRPLDVCGEWLGKTVFDPIEQALRSQELILIPTGQAGLLPIEAAWLPDSPRPSGRRYIGDTFTIRYAPSARVLLRTPKAPSEPRFVGIADPESKGAPRLPFGETEIRIAASSFSNELVMEGAQATSKNVSPWLSRGTVVHLACHATSSFSQPFDSGLALAGDDWLYLWQLASIDFSAADLVILSGCESAKVTRQAADQSVSLSSALLGAGARAIIATAWNIDDPATAILMLSFYHAWQVEKQSPAAALQKARQWIRDTTNGEKVQFCESLLPDLGGTAIFDVEAVGSVYRLLALKDPKERSYLHPHYWAAFSYFGQ